MAEVNQQSGTVTGNTVNAKQQLIVGGIVRSSSIKPIAFESDVTIRGANVQSAIPIQQSDFDTGTLRLTRPGKYEFVSDVVFNPPYGPSSTRSDTPPNGFWFASISIECDGVEIDGKDFTISQSNGYASANKVGVFVSILLGNNTFAGNLFGTGGSKFADTTSYIAANKVTIKNLNFAFTQHFGVLGNNNDYVKIDNCTFVNNQIADVAFQGPHFLTLTNSTLNGSYLPLPQSSASATLALLQQNLQAMVQQGVSGAAAQLAALNVYVLANPSRFAATDPNPTTLYGLFIYAGASAISRFPMNSSSLAVAEAFSAGRTCKDIVIENVTFNDFTCTSNEVIGIGTNIAESPNNVPTVGLTIALFGLFGTIEWKDAFNGVTFAPNAYLQALAFVLNQVYPTLPVPVQGLIPANTQNIITSILTSNQTLFNNNVAPIVGLQGDGQFGKGLFGIRIIGAENVTLNNIHMNNFVANGPLAVNPTTLPGYGSLSAPQPIIRTRINDAWFMSFEVCTNVTTSNLYMDGLLSSNGFPFGVHFPSEALNASVTNSHLLNVSAPNTTVTSTVAAGRTFGYSVQNNTGGIILQNTTTHNLTAGGTVTAFPTPSATISLTNAANI